MGEKPIVSSRANPHIIRNCGGSRLVPGRSSGEKKVSMTREGDLKRGKAIKKPQ